VSYLLSRVVSPLESSSHYSYLLTIVIFSILQIFSLLKGEMFDKSSLLITCLPEQVAELSPFCQKRLINLGLDPNSREKFIERYALLNRNIGTLTLQPSNMVSSYLYNVMGRVYFSPLL